MIRQESMECDGGHEISLSESLDILDLSTRSEHSEEWVICANKSFWIIVRWLCVPYVKVEIL